jgi:hypothetical protein
MTTPTAEPLLHPAPGSVPDFRALMARIAQQHPTWTPEAVREAAIAQRRRERGESA